MVLNIVSPIITHKPFDRFAGSVLENDFWTPPSPPINFVHDHFFSANQYTYLGLGKAPQPFWAECCGQEAERYGQGAGRCGHITNNIDVILMRSMYKIDRRGGGSKTRSLGNPHFLQTGILRRNPNFKRELILTYN